ncbi:MAG TPA: hypothetical protein VI160_09820 [Gemmatimonadales bacterium]
MTRKKKDKVTVRVPNPAAPAKERLRTPSPKRHDSKKDYRRRPKHPGSAALED